MVFQVGRFYWYEFVFNGARVRKSTRQSNYRAAVDMEAAHRTRLAKGDAGLESRPPAPTLRQFERTFTAWVERDKKNLRTRAFYKTNFVRLQEFGPLASARLNEIDEPMIERFKGHMDASGVSKTTVNRYLSTLRKALRYASLKLRLFDRLPIIALYSKADGAEREREFVFSAPDYLNWLSASPEPLRSASVLARTSGICRGEMLAIQRDCVVLWEEPDAKGLCGYLDVRRGLKRSHRRRKLPITATMQQVLLPLLEQSRCAYLFTSLTDRTQPLSAWTLEDQLQRTRKLLKLDSDAGLHTLRHTFLTEKARSTDPFTLQKIAGHANIATTMRYVHPEQGRVEDAFAVEASEGKATTSLEILTPKIPPTENTGSEEPVYN